MKKVKKRFLQDGSLSPAFAERVTTEVDVYHTLGRSLAVAHLYGAYESDTQIYLVQELCTGDSLTIPCMPLHRQRPAGCHIRQAIVMPQVGSSGHILTRRIRS